jgi:tripartite-type tricarboxylate transporter receptor subunit TctC
VVNAVTSGEADVAIVNAVAAMGPITAGKVHALAVNTGERQPALPEVPTFAEAGVHGFDFGIWLGMYAPSGVPAEVVARLHAAVNAALASVEVRSRLAALGMTPIAASPQEVRAMLERDRKAYGARARQLRHGAR